MTITLHCWRCMKHPVESPYEECESCYSQSSRSGVRRKEASDMSLERLIATQETGAVPGDYRWNVKHADGEMVSYSPDVVAYISDMQQIHNSLGSKRKARSHLPNDSLHEAD